MLVLWFFSAAAEAEEFTEDVERDFPLRTIGRLQVTNLRGGIEIHGWSLDKIRIRARRKATAPSREDAARIFASTDFRYREIEGDIELSAEYGKGLDINQRLKENAEKRSSMEMVVYAPTGLKLRLWTAGGFAKIRNWTAAVEARTATGGIDIEGVRSEVSLLCTGCKVRAVDVRGPLRCMGGTGDVAISSVVADNVYVETSSGSQQIDNVTGDQLYVSKSGRIQAHKIRGHIEFHAGSGAVTITEGSGFLSGRSESADISASMKFWKFEDRAIIESVRGNVLLALPAGLSADVELFSEKGMVSSAFKVLPSRYRKSFGPDPANHIIGHIGEGGEQLRLSSQHGAVKLLRGG